MSHTFRRRALWGTLVFGAIAVSGSRILPLIAQEDVPQVNRIDQSASPDATSPALNQEAHQDDDSKLLPLLSTTLSQTSPLSSSLQSTNVSGSFQAVNLDKADSELAQLIESYQRALAKGEKESNAEQRKRIREIVTLQFQSIEARRSKEIESLETRLSQLKSIMAIRSENADRIIDRRVQQLVGEKDVLDWNSDSANETKQTRSALPKAVRRSGLLPTLSTKLPKLDELSASDLALADRKRELDSNRVVPGRALPLIEDDSSWLVPAEDEQKLANQLAEAKVNLGRLGVGMAGVYQLAQATRNTAKVSQDNFSSMEKRFDAMRENFELMRQLTETAEGEKEAKKIEEYKERLRLAQKELEQGRIQLEKDQKAAEESQRMVVGLESSAQEYKLLISSLEEALKRIRKPVEGKPLTKDPNQPRK